MSDELRAYIDERLKAAWHTKLVKLGYWCPRCDCEAYPVALPAGESIGAGGDGWCPFCGLNPRTPGPAPEPTPKVGILGAASGAQENQP